MISHNTIDGVTTVHGGAENWRFAWALMAGTSYCLTNELKLDVGYRYSHINGGRMFELASVVGGAGPGFDDGFDVHEARAGLRYQFDGGSGCAPEPDALRRRSRSTNRPRTRDQFLRPPGQPPGGFRLSARCPSIPCKKTDNHPLSLTAI